MSDRRKEDRRRWALNPSCALNCQCPHCKWFWSDGKNRRKSDRRTGPKDRRTIGTIPATSFSGKPRFYFPGVPKTYPDRRQREAAPAARPFDNTTPPPPEMETRAFPPEQPPCSLAGLLSYIQGMCVDERPYLEIKKKLEEAEEMASRQPAPPSEQERRQIAIDIFHEFWPNETLEELGEIIETSPLNVRDYGVACVNRALSRTAPKEDTDGK